MDASKIDAEMNLGHLEDVFNCYGCDIHKWVVCYIGENYNVNKWIARYIEVLHVDCLSHRINLEVNYIVSSHTALHLCL